MDGLFIFLLVFSAVVGFFAPHFFPNIGVFSFARYTWTAPDALAILNIIGYCWNGFLTLISLIAFNIPGLEVISAVYDALVTWLILRFVRSGS